MKKLNKASWINDFPCAIWHKERSGQFIMQKEGNKIGYANESGWYFYGESKQEFIECYQGVLKKEMIKPK